MSKKTSSAEREAEKLIQERDDAEQFGSQLYYIVTGRSPEWSNFFGHKEATEEVQGTVAILKKALREANQTIAKLRANPVFPRLNEESLIVEECKARGFIDEHGKVRNVRGTLKLDERGNIVAPDGATQFWVMGRDRATFEKFAYMTETPKFADRVFSCIAAAVAAARGERDESH